MHWRDTNAPFRTAVESLFASPFKGARLRTPLGVSDKGRTPIAVVENEIPFSNAVKFAFGEFVSY